MAIYFYKEFGPLGYLANYSNHGFYKDEVYYKTVEHYYQSKKFLDKDLENKIINVSTPKEASNIGRDRNNPLRKNWKKIKQDVMLEGVLLKFRQNPDILIKLINTGNDEIYEDTVDEYYWGVGKSKTGENHFGKILVKAREILRQEYINKLISDLRNESCVYIIGHNNIDVDSYFSAYILSNILRSFNINSVFAIMDYYNYQDDSKDVINDYKIIEPIILENCVDKKFVLVDHNDIKQSLNESCNILFAIDHHIESNTVSNCLSFNFTSSLLAIYYLFKDIYEFNEKEKELIALSVVFDSEFLTSVRFREEDKLLFDELKADLNIEWLKKKYFKTTNFLLNITDNIMNNHKFYNLDNKSINRVLFKTYKKDRKYIQEYLNEIDNLYTNNLLIWNEYDSLKTLVFYNTQLVKEYDCVLTSSVIIIKDLIMENIIK